MGFHTGTGSAGIWLQDRYLNSMHVKITNITLFTSSPCMFMILTIFIGSLCNPQDFFNNWCETLVLGVIVVKCAIWTSCYCDSLWLDITLVTNLNTMIQDLHLGTCVTFVSRLECMYIWHCFLFCGKQVCFFWRWGGVGELFISNNVSW